MKPGSPSRPCSGATDPDHPDRRPGAARPGPRRAQQRHAREPAGAAGQLRHGADARRPPAEDVTQDPIVRGKTAAQALNRRGPRSPRSLRNSTIVNQALGGEEPHDVSLLVASLGQVSGALVQSEHLQGLISNFDSHSARFASQSSRAQHGGRPLPGALTTPTARSPRYAASPATRLFARPDPGEKRRRPRSPPRCRGSSRPSSRQPRRARQPLQRSSRWPTVAALTRRRRRSPSRATWSAAASPSVLIPAGNAS